MRISGRFLVINSNHMIQSGLVYLLLTLDGSFLLDLHKDLFKYGILAFGMLYMLIYRRLPDIKTFIVLMVLLSGITFVRIYNSGGVGLDVWTSYASAILLAYITVQYNEQQFIETYIKVVCFLAVISLICWMAGMLAPDLLRSILSPSIAVDYDRSLFYGRILYVMRDDTLRNVGIYPEPGRYQVALTMALFLLLFYSHKTAFSKRRIMQYMILLMLTILTAQSTSGYLSMAAVMVGYIMSKNIYEKEMKGLRRNLLILIAIAVCYLMLDYNIKGMNSLFGKYIMMKLFSGKELDLAASTGKYRMESIIITVNAILKNPFGQGYDKVNLLKKLSNISAVGNGLLSAMAAEGIIPIFYTLYWMFKPVYKNGPSKIAFLVFIFMYINSTLSQAYVLYPSYIILTYINYNRYRMEWKGIYEKNTNHDFRYV